MNSGLTSERVYETLKRRLLDNEFRPGERLEPALLADGVASSVTPVREALNVLTGERLLDARSGGGFYVPPLDQPGLSDLYAWNSDVLGVAVRAWPPGTIVVTPPLAGDDAPFAIRRCFAALAEASHNPEHGAALDRLSDRLNAVRRVELIIVGDPAAALGDIGAAASRGDRRTLARLLVAFHRVRVRQAAAIVRQLYRHG